jgi:hypothetical protein
MTHGLPDYFDFINFLSLRSGVNDFLCDAHRRRCIAKSFRRMARISEPQWWAAARQD